VPVELLVAVFFVLSVVVNAALLVWVYRADHVTVHWSRRVQSIFVGLRPQRSADGATPPRRRPLYVAERGDSPRGTAPGGGGSGQRVPATVRAAPATVPAFVAPQMPSLPPDLAELLLRPAAMAPRGDFSAPDEPLPEAANVLARVADDGRGNGASRLTLDPLTGLEGPASWSRIIDIENARLLRYRRPVTVVMAEVEGLQRLAERLGDEPVDRLLPMIADALRREARSSDWVARLGSGRFAVFLAETDEIQAINYVERIWVSCEPWLASSAVSLRLAIGWSSPSASTDLEHAIAEAEARMHVDRRVPGKLPQPPRSGPARVFSLAAGSPATEGLSDLAESPVAPSERGGSAPRDGRPTGASNGGIDSEVELAGGPFGRQTRSAAGEAEASIPAPLEPRNSSPWPR
jgi:diguanylate cyclase (GGDEF)-like protein